MKFHKNKLLTTVSAIALVLAVGACSSSSDDDEMAVTPPPATDDEMAVTPPPATDDEMAGTPPATDDEMAGTPPATDDEMAGTPPATPDPGELADTAYGEYLEALRAYEVAQGVHALTPTAANLAALREAVNKVVTEATEALISAGAGTAAQLVRAQDAVDATVMDSNDVAVIEDAVMDAADLVTALADAGTAATTYDSAKADYEATEGMTQANLDALSNAATAAKEKADAALVLAAGGSAAQLSEAQAAVAAADVAATHASGITMALEAGIADALTAYNTAKTEHATAKTAHDEDASLDNANALKTAAGTLLAAAMDADEKGALGATADQQMELASVSVTNAEAYVATAEDDLTTAQTAADAAAVVATPDPVELADTAYGEYLEALTAYEVAQGVHALTPTAANLAALREAVNKVVTAATEALTSAGAGTAAQLVRAQDAVDATATDSSDVAVIEAAVMAAAELVTGLADAGTAATAYDGAKAAYEATGGMTQANLDALSNAATEAKATAYAALEMAQGGSAAQLSEAQVAVDAADMAFTHASGITMALEAGIADALTAYNTAKTEHAAAKTAHDEDASLDNANALKTAADTLLASAMDAEEKGALGATAEQQTELASVSVTDAEPYVAVADTAVTTAQTAADAAAVVATTAADAAAVVAATAEAVTKTTAIAVEAVQPAVAGIGGTTVGVTTYAMTIKRPRSGTVIEITDTAFLEDDDPKFTLYTDLGEGRTMHTRKMEADPGGNVVEEVVIVSTDIETPKAVAFAIFESDADGSTPQMLTVNPKTTGGGDHQSITVLTENSAQVMSAMFAAAAAGTLDFDSNNTETDDTDEAFETAGTYNGAMGTYRCDGSADCMVTLDAKGAVTGVSEGWIFTPDPRATSDQPDYDYLHYGFWLKKTTDEDGVLTYNEVETFAGSSLAMPSGSVSDVEGSATYNGGATGVYVKDVHNSDGTLDTATAGHFTAAATLKVNFSGTSVAIDDQNTITGTINKFELSGGEENAWSAALKSDMFTPAAGTASGTANGGGAEGAFTATFYGDTDVYDHDGDGADGTAMINRQPGSVVGEFGANFSNGSVAGGFGARK